MRSLAKIGVLLCAAYKADHMCVPHSHPHLTHEQQPLAAPDSKTFQPQHLWARMLPCCLKLPTRRPPRAGSGSRPEERRPAGPLPLFG